MPNDSALAEKEFVTPEDLVGITVLLPSRISVRNELSSWLGDHMQNLNVTATFNLIYNAVVMARKASCVILTLKLHCNYDGMTFVPLKPSLMLSSVLTWKERQILSPTTTAFIEFVKKCSKGIK